MRRGEPPLDDPLVKHEIDSFWKSRFGVEPKEVLLVAAALPFFLVNKVFSAIRDATLGRVERAGKRAFLKAKDVLTGQKRYQSFVESDKQPPESAEGGIKYYSGSLGDRLVEPVRKAVSGVVAKVGKQTSIRFEDKEMAKFLEDQKKK